MTITILPAQADVLAWVRVAFPNQADVASRAMKLGEEAGEVLGAVIKIPEGRKTLDDLSMELAQTVLCAMSLAEAAGIHLNTAIADEWRRVNVEAGL